MRSLLMRAARICGLEAGGGYIQPIKGRREEDQLCNRSKGELVHSIALSSIEQSEGRPSHHSEAQAGGIAAGGGAQATHSSRGKRASL